MDIIKERGEFSIDEKNIIKACVHQFADEERWIVELLLNSLDAESSEITVYGVEKEDRYAIHVEDNGHGMDDKTCDKCVEKFNSIKESDDPYGEFGLGIISPGHDPSQCNMTIISKTKDQSNEIQINGPITSVPEIIIRSDPAINEKTGTTVIVEFQKKQDFSLRNLLRTLYEYATKILQYIQVPIYVRFPASDDNDPEIHTIGLHNWEDEGLQYKIDINYLNFEIILSADKHLAHGVFAYQKRILVSKSFTEIDLPQIPYVQIKINSNSWKLPIGRDKIIINESLSRSLTRLRNRIMSECFELLYSKITNSSEYDGIVEPIVISLLKNKMDGPWLNHPIFQVYSKVHPLLSYNELQEMIKRDRSIYILKQKTDLTGIDYEKIYPIINMQQSSDLMQLIIDRFKERLSYIESTDGIYIEPLKNHDPRARRFLSKLKFDFSPLLDKDFDYERTLGASFSFSECKRSVAIDNQPAKNKNKALLEELMNIKISLGYLRNSATSGPNFEYKFYYSREMQRIVFNLLHPTIQKLIKYKDPSLAAHRALCLALTEENSGILQDLRINPKVIDALLSVDLLARFKAKDTLPFQAMLKRFNDIMDNYN